MTDSYQKIIDDMGFIASDIAKANIPGFGNQVLGLQERLEALRAQPVAWMDKDGCMVKTQGALTAEIFYIPLIRAD